MYFNFKIYCFLTTLYVSIQNKLMEKNHLKTNKNFLVFSLCIRDILSHTFLSNIICQKVLCHKIVKGNT